MSTQELSMFVFVFFLHENAGKCLSLTLHWYILKIEAAPQGINWFIILFSSSLVKSFINIEET